MSTEQIYLALLWFIAMFAILGLAGWLAEIIEKRSRP